MYKQLQLWKCQVCGHTFYTSVTRKQAWYRRMLFLSEAIECPSCSALLARRQEVVRKLSREEGK